MPSKPSNADPGFIHLRLRSEFSIVKGIARPDALVAHSAKLGMPALALADKENLYGLIKFHQACHKQGLKPLTACELMVQPQDQSLPAGRMLFLVRNKTGYQNLLKLVSEAHLNPMADGSYRITEQFCKQHAQGLLVLSGDHQSTIGQLLALGKPQAAAQWAESCQRHWQDAFYIEVQRTGRPNEEAYLQKAVILASEQQIPLVATHDTCFLERDDFAAHETKVCIQESVTLNDPGRSRNYTEEQYMKSPQEMAELFKDLPEALIHSVEIAKRCNFIFEPTGYHLPRYQDESGRSEEELLEALALEKVEVRCKEVLAESPERRQKYLDRVKFELKVITEMGFSGYFLIVMEFVDWAKKNGIPVGPARGSGAGSLIAYVLNITDLDPIKYRLLFERFLNPERKSMPDFDIDFCINGRDRVIGHVVELYGKDTVSQIITFNTMAAKAVIRDVTRVQDKPFGLGDRLTKLIPNVLNITLRQAVKGEPALHKLLEEDSDAAEIIDMAYRLEGGVRSCGKHPGGVVIAPGALSDYVPLTLDEHHATLIQFDKDDSESVGLVKFDFLGLKTLTIIERAVKMINERRPKQDSKLLITDISIDDPKVYKDLQKAETKAVFQLESRGMRQLIAHLKPTEFEDLVALVALYRPGPLGLGMSDEYAKRKHGKSIKLHHPMLEPILNTTYGVVVYQEQVMEIARQLGGYSLGEADILRRAMSKKNLKEMEKQRVKFTTGATENGISDSTSGQIFDLLLEFAGYGFNRSHSVGYALIAYQTAWLKCHYPAEFMAAALSSAMGDTDELADMMTTCREMGLHPLPPEINRSQYHFTVLDDSNILYGLGAVKGVGEGAAENLAAGAGSSPYHDLFDLCARQAGERNFNKKAMEALIKAGSLDHIPVNLESARAPSADAHRATMLACLEQAFQLAGQQYRDRQDGMIGIFDDTGTPLRIETKPAKAWSERQKLTAEYESLGLYLSSHPTKLYAQEFASEQAISIAKLASYVGSQKISGGLLAKIRKHTTRKGERMAFVVLEDESGRTEAIISSELWEKEQESLKTNQVVLIKGTVEPDEYTDGIRIKASSLASMETLRNRIGVYLCLDTDNSDGDTLNKLSQVLERHRGPGCCPAIRYHSKQALADLTLDPKWRVRLTDDCLSELRSVFGDAVHLGSPEHHLSRAG